MAEDSIREKSSSGGVFYYAAKWILSKQGVVFGAAFDRDIMELKHFSTDDISLENLMRSKYVQSFIGDVFRKVKTELDNNRIVLFCGTPCQIAGLQLCLGVYENLYTIDFSCLGVPSPGYFDEMIRSEAGNKNVVDVTFREKDLGWREKQLKIYFEDGTMFCEDQYTNLYYYFFFNNVLLRKSCYSCEMPNRRNFDITVMDYWAIQSDDNKGVSACVINTSKGQELFDNICTEGNKIDKIDSHVLRKNFVPHYKMDNYSIMFPIRNSYMRYFSRAGYEKTVQDKSKRTIAFIRMYRGYVSIKVFFIKTMRSFVKKIRAGR